MPRPGENSGTEPEYIPLPEENMDLIVTAGDGENDFQHKTPDDILDMSRNELEEAIPDNWDYQEHNGFVHIRDENGTIRIRIDPADNKTTYPHMHIYDEKGNPLDIMGNMVPRNSHAGHLPYGK